MVEFSVYVLTSKTVKVIFTESVSNNMPVYYVLDVVGSLPGGVYIPSIVDIKFDDSKTSAVITFEHALTLHCMYTLSIIMPDVVPNSYNFLATVYDAPKVVGAFQSGISMIDLVFDRPVGQYSDTASAVAYDGDNTDWPLLDLSLVAWDQSIPENNIRFNIDIYRIYDEFFDFGDNISIEFTDVCDISRNFVTGNIYHSYTDQYFSSVNLTTKLRHGTSAKNLGSIQATSAFIDRSLVETLNEAVVRVYFSAPIDASTVGDGHFYAYKSSHHHVVGPIGNYFAFEVFDLDGLAEFTNTARSVFVDHVSPLSLRHNEYKLINITDIIKIVNEMKAKFNVHVINDDIHKEGSTGLHNVIELPNAKNFDGCVAILKMLKTNFNSHKSINRHEYPDNDHVIVNGVAYGINGVVSLIDELKIKLSSHFSSTKYHPYHDIDNIINSKFVGNEVITTCAEPYNDIIVYDLINELQERYADHIQLEAHVYIDKTNVIEFTRIMNDSTIEFASDAIHGMALAQYKHSLNEVETEVLSIRNFASINTGVFNVDSPYTYFCDLSIKLDSLVPDVKIKCAVTSEGNVGSSDINLYVTFDNYTGIVTAKSMYGSSTNMLTKNDLDGHVMVRMDRDQQIDDILLKNVETKEVKKILGINKRSSLQNLMTLVYDTIQAYNFHIAENGVHGTSDNVNNISNVSFPGVTEASIIESVNTLALSMKQHFSCVKLINIILHKHGSSFQFTDALTIDEAFKLINYIKKTLKTHMGDVFEHNKTGSNIMCAKTFDEVVIDTTEFKHGDVYDVMLTSYSVLVDKGDDVVLNKNVITSKLNSIALAPSMASVLVKPGIANNNLLCDQAFVHFSKQIDIRKDYGSISISGGDVKVISHSWVSDNVLALNVTKMDETQYMVTINGFVDNGGNVMY